MKRTLVICSITVLILILALTVFRPPWFISAIGGWESGAGRYEHIETTGLMDSVTLSDGRSLIIRFTPDSDATAIAALDHIGKSMIFGTSDDQRKVGGIPFRQSIVLRGEVAKVKNRDFFSRDDFHWFRLSGWTLELPFDVRKPNDLDSDVPPKVQSCANFADAGVKDLILDRKVIRLDPFLTGR